MLPARCIFSPRRRGQHRSSPCQPICFYFVIVRPSACAKSSTALSLQSPIDQRQQRGCQNHPCKLIPVEKGKAPQRRCGARIDLRKTKSEVRQCEQQQDPVASAFRFGVRCELGLHSLQSIFHLPLAGKPGSSGKVELWPPPYQRSHSWRPHPRRIR
jgi:hypothetical protein